MRLASESEALVDHTLSRLFRFVQRARFAGVALLTAVGLLFLVHDDQPWKPILLGLGACFLLTVSLRDLRRRRDVQTPGEVVALSTSILTMQLILIIVTGGIRSPFLIVLAPLMFALAFSTSGFKWYRLTYLELVLGIVVLGLGDLLGAWPPDALVPEVLARDDRGPASGYVYGALVAFTFLTVFVAFVGGVVRRRMQAAVDSATAARAEALEATRARHRELFALSGVLAHELKNPLASIRGLAVLLARKLPEASQDSERMGVLLGEVQRMGTILDEFLNFSRPAESLAASLVRAEQIVADVGSLHEGEAAALGVRIKSEVTTSATLLADARKLKQLLMNLVQNALEASPAGGTVVVRSFERGDEVVFEVLDQGPGLAPEIGGRLFSVGATTKAGGTGLGLVIARGIAEQHGGSVTLDARGDGPGCVARLTLPKSREGRAA